jgi:hypothetical protein
MTGMQFFLKVRCAAKEIVVTQLIKTKIAAL